MTKRRAPLTYELALTRVVDLIGWDGAADIVGVKERAVRNWSDPDIAVGISLERAELLDRAYLEAGGEAPPPFQQCYSLRLEVAIARSTNGWRNLLGKVASAAVETGQAFSATIHAARHGATLADKAIAKRETEEAINELAGIAAALDDCDTADHLNGEHHATGPPRPG